jgi:hypothetical protein
VSDIAVSEGSLRDDLVGPGRARDWRETLSVGGSVVAHGLVLALLLLAPPFGAQGLHGAVQLMPIEIVAPRAEQAAPAKPVLAGLSPGETTGSLPSAPTAPDMNWFEKVPPADELESKLQALAKLRQPDSDRLLERQSASTAPLSTESDDAAAGRLANLKDFIRVQVERHWSLNLASLGNSDVSVPIAVEITGGGVVLKAEILDGARSSDPAYHDIAVSARNAVLLASPLALPAGDYKGVMQLVLDLNPREAVR